MVGRGKVGRDWGGLRNTYLIHQVGDNGWEELTGRVKWEGER